MQRRKGNRIENEIVHAHKNIGIHADRVPLSGGSHYRGEGHDVDIYAFGKDEAPAVAEVKARSEGRGFALLERWLSDYDALFLKRDRQEPLVVLPWRMWARLCKGKDLTWQPEPKRKPPDATSAKRAGSAAGKETANGRTEAR